MRRTQLSGQARDLSRLTRDLSRCCQTKEEQLFKQFDLSCAEGRVLLCIADVEPTTATAVAKRLDISKGRLSPLVENLVRKGLVERRESLNDRRTNQLVVTSAGRKLSQAALEYQVSFHERLLQHFRVEERQQLLNMLQELRSAIDELRGELAS